VQSVARARGCGTVSAMLALLGMLVTAAVLEVGGDAAIRHGLNGPARGWLAAGAAALVAYGLLVNGRRTIEFNRLMGTYIVVFFVVSQVIAWAWFGERPSVPLLAGGALIVAGGLVMQVASP